ncbi:H-type lectin domain-containing protein [Neptunicoccus cionae]|uniref:H-type lectin domain-containing protein n=1 Tax=Neptunicoccus cionae TaxID=2035344 RepID=UPI000C75B46E|nr:H-type lectin domain-containing protein [Amylibacter cionae]PLS23568.1 hypothetical protein C0U40_05505 [Amylibacter cionae]
MLFESDQIVEPPSLVASPVKNKRDPICEEAHQFDVFKQSYRQTVLHLPAGMVLVSGEQELFNHVDPNDFMWTGHGERSVSRMIVFQHPFCGTPGVSCSLSSFDCSKAQNLRYRLEVDRAGQQGFRIAIHTWGDTKIARCTIRWQALGAG